MNQFSETMRAKLLALPETCRIHSMRRFSSLFSQGQPASALFLIEEGLLKLTRTNEDGETIILSICGPGDLVGEETLRSDNGFYHTNAEVLAPATLFRTPKEALHRALDRGGDLGRALLNFQVTRRQALAEKIELLCLNDVEERIIHHLAELSTLVNKTGEFGEGSQLPITQAELAELVGATRETTSTTLNQLERRGLIQLSRRLVTIPFPAKLEHPRAAAPTMMLAAKTA